MTRSYKMVLLETFQNLGGWQKNISLKELAEQCWYALHRRPHLVNELPNEIRSKSADSGEWHDYWIKNPVNAWIGGNIKNNDDEKRTERAFFEVQNGYFQAKLSINQNLIDTFIKLTQELIDFRFATYEARKSNQQETARIIPFNPKKEQKITNLPYFDDLRIACGHFRTSTSEVQEYRNLPASYGTLDPARHFIARASGNSMNGGKNPIHDGDYLLLELISASNAGSVNGQIVAIERQDETGDNQYLLRSVIKKGQGQYILKANNPAYKDLQTDESMRTLARLKHVIDPLDFLYGQSFMREEIPDLFGTTFNPGSWNSGHITLEEKNAHILLVTLNKSGKNENERYTDYWIDENTFHWQSQNSTSPTKKRGREIIEHKKLNKKIFLFIREQKLLAGKAAPFVFHGSVDYQSHEGSEPMNVVFKLNN